MLFREPVLIGAILSLSMVFANRLNKISPCDMVLMPSFTGSPLADAE